MLAGNYVPISIAALCHFLRMSIASQTRCTMVKSKAYRNGNGRQKRDRNKVRYAVVGLGYISQDATLPAFSNARKNSEVRALVTADPIKARRLSEKYDVPFFYPYEEFDLCLKSGEIDAVYIALPNSMHHAYAVAAANAGIHVLCEKPMALDETECKSMITAAEENGVKLMIAYRLHFERANLNAIEAIRSGKIGQPRIFSSVFTQQVSSGNIRLKRELGGGPVWDVGIYCVNAARYLFQSEPEEVFAFQATGNDERFSEVEESVTAVLRFPDARLATFTCSFGASDVSEFQVVGTKGNLRADPAYDFSQGLQLKITVNGKTRESVFPKSDQFAPELLYFSDCILNNRNPEPSGKEGLADVRIIRAIYESMDTRKPVSIQQTEIERRPRISQEINRPPVLKPQLVRAASPSR
jgi:predicted dehydrogenase